ncbi:hypothetical protein WR25_04540 [Diploscapter pachys]|uniref:Uncharacterized protein n=1 Tax=Diploscapter pachys TaxID=2018661 RepID=A0A2A2LG59_9BILA|nr:hypothetical protein WR25_04540 [Diploscapter pachys]
MNCLPDPSEMEVSYDIDVDQEIARVLGHAIDGSASLGHEGHPHHDLENFHKKSANYQRKPHRFHSAERLSYGARIYSPSGGQYRARSSERTNGVSSHEARNSHSREYVTPRPKLRRKILTPRSHRQILVTPPPIEAEPPSAPPITPAPTMAPFTMPTMPTMMPTMPTMPTLPTLPPMFNPFLPSPQSPFLSFMAPQAAQTSNMFPFGLQSPPSPMSPYGLSAPGFGQTYGVSGTQSSAPQPMNIFGVPQQPQQSPMMSLPNYGQQQAQAQPVSVTHIPVQPQPQPVQQIQIQPSRPAQFAAPNYSPQQSNYAQQQQILRNPSKVQPLMKVPGLPNIEPGMDEKPEVVEPQLAPSKTKLNDMYQPPQFNNLGNTLNNFQATYLG